MPQINPTHTAFNAYGFKCDRTQLIWECPPKWVVNTLTAFTEAGRAATTGEAANHPTVIKVKLTFGKALVGYQNLSSGAMAFLFY